MVYRLVMAILLVIICRAPWERTNSLELRRPELVALVGGGLVQEDPVPLADTECKRFKTCTEVFRSFDRCNEAGNPNNPYWITNCGGSCTSSESCAAPTDSCKTGETEEDVFTCQDQSGKTCDPNGDGITDCGNVRQGICSVSSIFWDTQGCQTGVWRLKCTGGDCQDSGSQVTIPCPDWYKCKTLP